MPTDRPVELRRIGEPQADPSKPVLVSEPKARGKVERVLYPPTVDATMAVNAQLVAQEGR